MLKPRWTWGQPAIRDQWGEPLYRDPSGVVPAFADKVERLMERLRARGFDPEVREAYRTPARAKRLATESGTGIEKSLHSYGGAVDIVERGRGWEGTSEAFKDALGQEAERLGLTWGGRFGDWAHVQAVPLREQSAFRAGTWTERNALAA